jgi:FKBP-type peptidyl-prolyl cis-trans isomerase (trigger factor)
MKIYRRFAALLCAALTISLITTSCSQTWNGYENTDLSQYVTVGKYKGVTITLQSTEVTDADIQSKIDEVLSEHQYENEITDRAVAADDYVRVDYSSTVDGKADTTFMGTDVAIQIGAGAFMTQLGDIEGAFIGHNKGDTFTVNGTFPESYQNDNIDNVESYIGKTIVFQFTIKKVFQLAEPELTDEFVAGISSTSQTVDEYKEEIRAELADEKVKDAEQQKISDAWAAVMDTVTVKKYPQTEVDAAVTEMTNYYTSLAQQIDSKLTLEEYVTNYMDTTMDEFNSNALSYAQGTVSEQMTLYYIIKKENITISDDEYESGLSDYATKYSFESPEAFESYYGTDLVRQSMLWDKTIAFIIDNAQIVKSSETAADTTAAG